MKVCLGGTFDILHNGHLALLKRGFEIGDYVLIGLTTDKFGMKNRMKINSYEKRKKVLINAIKKFDKKWKIVPIKDRYGPAIYEELDCIVVSPETKKVADEINFEREKRGLNKLRIEEINFLLAMDGTPISSKRIRKGEIEKTGSLKKCKVIVCSEDKKKQYATRKVFSKIFGKKVNVIWKNISKTHGKKLNIIDRARVWIENSNANFCV
ncbi:MAG: phosphopantetheine adenylyltransferase, partial [Candidatus Thermoplasmatota archaeon]